MKVKKKKLEVLFNVVKGTEGALSLAESRSRDGFIKPLQDATQTFIVDRNKIYDTFATKREEKGDGMISWEIPPEKTEEIKTELSVLLEEEVDIEAPANLKDIIEKTNYKPKVGEAEVIDEIIAQI